MTMRISIAMATYNGAKYLQEQIDSFLHQTHQPDELVICDDGSTDATMAILEEFQKGAPFDVRVYQNEANLGFIKNFEKVLSLSTGDIIFLSDQDDVWIESKIEKMTAFLCDQPRVMVATNDQFITNSNLNSIARTSLENIRAAGLTQSWFVAGCCTSIKREFLEVILPIPREAHGHDAWISKLADALNVRSVYSVPLQFYRRHGENTSQSFASKLGRVSWLDLIKQYGLKRAVDGWQCDVDHYGRYLKRIEERSVVLARLGLDAQAVNGCKNLEIYITALKERIGIYRLPKEKRMLVALRYWLHGGYKNFSGWKSAVKDLIRP